MDTALTVRQSVSLITEADADSAHKIKMLLPYGGKLTDDNALALAAYSRLHGLDPFNGECYFLVREKKNNQGQVIGREELGVYPGIKAKRKLAKQQLANVDPTATYRIDYSVVSPEAIGIKAQNGEIALVIQAELRDTISTDKYIGNMLQLQKAGISLDQIKSIMGKPPVWVGFGVVKAQELNYIKMSPIALAKKRAESDATNQRFDLPFSNDALADDIAPEITEQLEGTGDNETVITVMAEPVQESTMTTDQAMMDLGYDAPTPIVQKEDPELELLKSYKRDRDDVHYFDMSDEDLEKSLDSLNDLKNETTSKARQDKIAEKIKQINQIKSYRHNLAETTVD